MGTRIITCEKCGKSEERSSSGKPPKLCLRCSNKILKEKNALRVKALREEKKKLKTI